MDRQYICGRGPTSKTLCGNELCGCWTRSFASHEKSAFIHNWATAPSLIFKHSHVRREFRCATCTHLFLMPLNDVVGGHFCPFCSGRRPPCGSSTCICAERSFGSNPLSQYKYGDWNPYAVPKWTKAKFSFKCPVCEHIFEIGIHSVMQGV
jgi:DNA-directed RNA polymerase subunit RPC12/RpoP